jgi:hypothetical protein
MTDRLFLEELQQLTTGVWFPSETDSTLSVVQWDIHAAVLTVEMVLIQVDKNAETPLKMQAFTDFFDYVTQTQVWHSEEEKANVVGLQTLVKTLEAYLTDLQVFRIGEADIEVYILGKTPSGNWVGVRTRVVKT